MVHVRSVLPVLMSGTHSLNISGNQRHSCLQALTKDISTPADIAPSALETIIFYCLIGYISALTYYLLQGKIKLRGQAVQKLEWK